MNMINIIISSFLYIQQIQIKFVYLDVSTQKEEKYGINACILLKVLCEYFLRNCEYTFCGLISSNSGALYFDGKFCPNLIWFINQQRNINIYFLKFLNLHVCKWAFNVYTVWILCKCHFSFQSRCDSELTCQNKGIIKNWTRRRKTTPPLLLSFLTVRGGVLNK